MENKVIKKNSYGETIEIKLENDVIKIKHSDIDDKFRSLNTFFKTIILSESEVVMIYKASQELNLAKKFPHLSPTLKKIFK